MEMHVIHARQLFKCLHAIADECILVQNNNAWLVNVMDPANIAMALVSVPVKSEHPTALGIDLAEIDSVLEEMAPSGNIHLELTELDGTPLLAIRQRMGETLFEEFIKCMPPEAIRKTRTRPVFEVAETLFASTHLFKQMIKLARKASDYITLETRIHSLAEDIIPVFIASAGDPRTSIVSTVTTITLPPRRIKRAAKSTFSLDYLEDLVNAVPGDTFTLGIGVDCPLTMGFEVAGGTAEYILCPRVAVEEGN